ncbi:hypothetical protein PORY_002596 [Pneumocystis oryctolagi]|uniref:Uncharacterized protein n=1 Tax=Pneumocystis oryctolagi TaxID=42067 RepID=A0ACB7CAY6_9ASCO|nr:hypothetical protein PORY_002596 [Pneumocystis oryctolagi]
MELFNRIITKKTCLSRSKAMDIRFNISVIEDWARMDTFQFESQINAKSSKSEHKFFSMYDCLRSHMEPLIQLLQWLQCVTSLDDIQNVQTTVETLNLLTSTQLLYVAKNYRLEVDENKVGKETIEYLSQQEIKQTSVQKEFLKKIKNKYTNHPSNTPKSLCSKKSEHSDLLMDAALMLPFTLPNNVDMLATYDSKIAETDIKKQKHFIPVIPSDFMDILNKRTNDNNNNNESQQTKTSYSEELNNEILNDKAAENNVS